MCGIAGWVDHNNDLRKQKEVLAAMQDAISRRGPDAKGEYIAEHAGLVHRRLAVVDIAGGRQPMQRTVGNTTYTIVYNGELYNTDELRAELVALGHEFTSTSDTAVLLAAYIQWGAKALKKLNGIFAFAVWNDRKRQLFAARDPMGVKPFFFKRTENGIVFASELKSLFKNPNVPAVLDKNGINQIFLFSPGRIPGSGVYRDVEELLAGESLTLTRKRLTRKKYFEFRAMPHKHDLAQTLRHLRALTLDAIDRQLVSDVPLACFLSGGLDSSIITYAAAKKYAREGKILTTYSVDFAENDKYFTKNEFQPDTDKTYIDLMSTHCRTDHKFVTLQNSDVVDALAPAASARDLPGMADVDASLLLFCKEVKRTHTVVLSGECADELFGGYPWFFTTKPDEKLFPWAKSLDIRKGLLNKKYLTSDPEKFVQNEIDKTTAGAKTLPSDTPVDVQMRKLFLLNVQWFMQTLLDRKDRMSMHSGLEVRVPFCDHRLAQYAYNIPWHLKALDGREKGLMRAAFVGILPHDIVYRKKNPYPKTFDPEFMRAVRTRATEIVNGDGVVAQLVDKDYFNTLLNENPDTKFFGQLMRLPQIFAWLCQMDTVFQEYNVKLVF